MTDRRSLHDLSALDDREVLMVVADRQLDQLEDLSALRRTLHGDDDRSGLVADFIALQIKVEWIMKRLSGSLRPPPAASWVDVLRAYGPYAAAASAIVAAFISVGGCSHIGLY